MDNLIQNIVQNYSIEELNKLTELLDNFKKQKKIELESSPTLFKFYNDYEHYIKNTLSAKYLKSVRVTFRHLIEFFGEDKLISEIRVKDAEDFIFHLMNRAQRGYAVYLRNLKASFSKAIEWGEISNNPFANIKVRKTQQTKPSFLSKEDFQKVIDSTPNKTMKQIFIFAFYTGCRLGEISELKWQHVDMASKTITIGDQLMTTKTFKQRIIPMSAEIYSILYKMYDQNINPQRSVFCKNVEFHYSREYISRTFKKVCRKVGLKEEIHFHSLRHSFASHLVMNGVPLVTIKELLGHSSILTTQIYSHVNYGALCDAINTLN